MIRRVSRVSGGLAGTRALKVEAAELSHAKELFKVQMEKLAHSYIKQAQTEILISDRHNPSSEVKCNILHRLTHASLLVCKLFAFPTLADFFGQSDPFGSSFGDPFGSSFGDPFGDDNFFGDNFFGDPFSICSSDPFGGRPKQQQNSQLLAPLKAFYKSVDGMDTFL